MAACWRLSLRPKRRRLAVSSYSIDATRLDYTCVMEPFDKIARQYQDAHSENPHQMRAVHDLVARLPPKAKVLDLGCGTGIPTARILSDAGHSVTGIDTSSKMLQLAKLQVPKAIFLQQDMVRAEFESGSYGAVTAYFSLLMLSRSQIVNMLTKVHKWLKPKGLFSFSMVEFDGDSVTVDFMGIEFPASGFLRESLPGLLTNHGFKVCALESVEHVPLVGPPEPQVFCLALAKGDS